MSQYIPIFDWKFLKIDIDGIDYVRILDFETGMFDTTKINMEMIGVSAYNEIHAENEEELFSKIPLDGIKTNECVFRENN